jgi:HlyD family secretion protein
MTEISAQEPAEDIDALLGLGTSSGRGLGARWRKLVIAGGLVAAALVVLVLLYWGNSVDAARYVTAPVTRGDLKVIVTATGSVQPTNQVDVSSELSGIVRQVLVDDNSPVKVGQVLAELDTDKLKATVESARAKLNAARAKVNEAEVTVLETTREYERKRTLAARNIAAAHDLDTASAAHDRAVAALASAQAEVVVAEADLKLKETDLAKACICSPINGVVLRRNVDPGQTVASSLQAPVLFSIAEDLKQMEVQVDVDEADVGKVEEGQKATFSVDAYPDRRFPATIRELRFAAETVQGVVTYKAVLTVDNSELLLRPGMTATAQITVHEVANALLVPNAALRFSPPAEEPAAQGGFLKKLLPGMPRFRPPSAREETGPARQVWVIRAGAPAAVPVVVGATDGNRTEILEGQIKPGDAVIVDLATATGR